MADFDPYQSIYGCDWRSCPAKAVVRVIFLIGELQFCSHHRNASGINKTTWGYAEEFDLDGADQLGAPPFKEPKARKITPAKPPAKRDLR